MTIHILCWARINSPENIRRFNSINVDSYRNKKRRLLVPKLMVEVTYVHRRVGPRPA